MTLITGFQKAPLHKRFNEAELLQTIVNRYRNFYKSITEQVRILQGSKEFIELCKDYYLKGYKDWIILGGIFNLLLNEKEIQNKFKGRAVLEKITNNQLTDMVKGFTINASNFNKKNMDNFIDIFFVTMLKTYGFEIRYPRMGMHQAEKFLKERMNILELDLPHKFLFIEGTNEWPALK